MDFSAFHRPDFDGTILVIVTWDTGDNTDQVLAHLPLLVNACRAEPGCLAFDVARDIESPHLFRLTERYASLDAFEAHRTSDHFHQYMQGQIAPLLTSREIVVHELPQR
jgi:quinol monooxygenase YgiN